MVSETTQRVRSITVATFKVSSTARRAVLSEKVIDQYVDEHERDTELTIAHSLWVLYNSGADLDDRATFTAKHRVIVQATHAPPWQRISYAGFQRRIESHRIALTKRSPGLPHVTGYKRDRSDRN